MPSTGTGRWKSTILWSTSGQKPWDYLTQFNISTAILEAHAVPVHLVREPHGDSVKEQYKAFLHERALQLAIAANTLLQRLTTGS